MIVLSKVLQHYVKSEETFVRNVFHSLEDVEQKGSVKEIGFCDPNEIRIINEIAKHFEVNITANGGYENAEKKSVVITPDYYEIENEVYIYELEYAQKFQKLKHNVVMGTLYNAGVSERKIGDIIVDDTNRCQIIVSQELYEVLPLLITEYGKIKVKYVPQSTITINSPVLQREKQNVKSLRLDSVIKGVTRSSRNEANNLINKGDVRVNYRQVKNNITQIAENDLISIKGYGRIIIKQIHAKNGKFNIDYETTNARATKG